MEMYKKMHKNRKIIIKNGGDAKNLLPRYIKQKRKRCSVTTAGTAASQGNEYPPKSCLEEIEWSAKPALWPMAWPLILQLQLSPPRVNNIRGMSLFSAAWQADRFDVSLQECHLE